MGPSSKRIERDRDLPQIIDFIYGAVDLLASQYGGGPEAIFNLGFDEVLIFIDKLNERKLSEYRMLSILINNPHTDKESQKQVADMLKPKSKAKSKPKLDVVGMEALKLAMSSNPRIIVK